MSTSSPPSPLTTIFTPPNSCKLASLSTWLLDEKFHDASHPHISDYNVYPSMNPNCVPSGYNTQTLTATPSFSPGVCPKDWTAAASFGASSTFTSWCCPKGLTWTSNTWGLVQCFTSWTQSGFAFSRTEVETKNGSTTETYLLMNEGTRTGQMIAQYTPIIVTWANSDLPNFTPASAPLNLIPAGAASATLTDETSRPVASLTSSSTATSSSLSTGAKAGIGVGVAIGAIAIIIAVVWFVLRRRRRRKEEDGQHTFEKAELHGETVDTKQPEVKRNELGEDGHIHEIGSADKPVEVGNAGVHELPTDFEGHEVRGDAQKVDTDTSDAKT